MLIPYDPGAGTPRTEQAAPRALANPKLRQAWMLVWGLAHDRDADALERFLAKQWLYAMVETWEALWPGAPAGVEPCPYCEPERRAA